MITLRYFSAAILYFAVAVTLGVVLSIDPYLIGFRTKAAHAHAALLGWVTLTIMGAMYQIVPTILGGQLHSQRLAGYQFWLMNLGIVGLFLSFLAGAKTVVLFGVITALAGYLFVYIMYRTVERKKLNLPMKFFAAVLVYFVIVVTLGIILSINPYPISGGKVITAHAHAALLGWVTLTIMGAMYQMLPMLALKELYRPALAEKQFWLINLGAAGLFLSFLAGKGTTLFGIITALASYLFVYIMYRTLRTEQKMKQPLDISVKYFIAALVYFSIVLALGIVLSIDPYLLPGRAITAHVHLALIGWVSITIVGAMYHLVPMLVWMERYGEKLGKEPVPAIKELYSERAANVQFWLLNLGLLGFFSGLLALQRTAMIISGTVIALGAYYFAYEMYKILYSKR
ncbi:MAG: cbb3-type cytochrome c oxidase subunit I [Euryarchaeota archaeon]|nr:cbb3-type cytochrome c oxidase subunit I [Euryarchaeota archaeon]